MLRSILPFHWSFYSRISLTQMRCLDSWYWKYIGYIRYFRYFVNLTSIFEFLTTFNFFYPLQKKIKIQFNLHLMDIKKKNKEKLKNSLEFNFHFENIFSLFLIWFLCTKARNKSWNIPLKIHCLKVSFLSVFL